MDGSYLVIFNKNPTEVYTCPSRFGTKHCLKNKQKGLCTWGPEAGEESLASPDMLKLFITQRWQAIGMEASEHTQEREMAFLKRKLILQDR